MIISIHLIVLALVAQFNLKLTQLNVKTALLHGDLEEEIYMTPPFSFQVVEQQHLVCRLKESLYGLKQSPHQLYMKFDHFMVEH